MKHIFSIIALLLSAVYAWADTPQEPKSLNITLNDGTVLKYNLTDIDHLWFEYDGQGQGSVLPSEYTTPPYAVGDYYYDGTFEGIVVNVDATGYYGKIVCLNEMPEHLSWGPMDVITGAVNVDEGEPNMEVVRMFDATYSDYPAFKACADMGQGWYLPAQRELQAMRSVLAQVNAGLESRGALPISDQSVIWSSSEADSYSDAMAFAADMGMPGMFGLQKGLLLPVRAFARFGSAPPARFTVGDIYTADGMTGMIYWAAEDDSYARIISLTQQEAAWGALGTTIGAGSRLDGMGNLQAARNADASLSAYPAFKVAADKGDGWYIPAAQELEDIAAMRTELNTMLARHGAPALETSYYWSSTEFENDAANSACATLMTDGSPLASSKSVSRMVRPIAMVGDVPSAETVYAVGDPYMEGGVVVGIVCQVEDGGTHGRVLGLTNIKETGRINAMWDKRANSDNYVVIGASSLDDGMLNMQAARANDPELANLTVFRLCADLGSEWYLPATNEMLAVYAQKAVINTALRANGGSTLDNSDYWTSTEGSENQLERATAVNMNNGSTFDYRKYFYNLARPMRKF